MPRFILKVKPFSRSIVAFSILPGIALFAFSSCGQKSGRLRAHYERLPIFEKAVALTAASDTLQPARLQLFKDTLFVSYLRRSQIDMYTPEFTRIGSIKLTDPEPIFPTSFAVDDSLVMVIDHSRNLVAIYRRDGSYVTSFGTFPDGSTSLTPFAMACHGGVLYVTDVRVGKVLAISMTDTPGITEQGELILTIPNDSLHALSFPSAVMVTPDGRLLAGDAGTGKINAFTCDGSYVYSFDSLQTPKTFTPQGFALDDMKDPTLRDTLKFDPSGLPNMGRIHVVDANNAAVHMFNPLGKYIASYSLEGQFQKPSGIAINRTSKRIFIADARAGRIFIFRYGE